VAVTITADVRYDPRPSVLLTVTTSPAVTAPLSLVRVHADGTEHAVIGAVPQQIVGGGWADVDHHLPYNQLVTYRVTVGNETATAQEQATMTVPWLISPDRPELSIPIQVKSISDRTQESRSAALRPIGAPMVAVSDGGQTWDGTSVSMVIEVDDEAPLRRLIQDSPVVLVNTPGAGWRIQWMWALIGQITWTNLGRAYWRTELVTLPLTEVAAPDIDLVGTWNAGVMAQTFAAEGKTAGDIVSLYANSLALITDTRL